VVEKGNGDEMIHLLGAIIKTCSLAGIYLNLNNVWPSFNVI
jgi:hypothetical protein